MRDAATQIPAKSRRGVSESRGGEWVPRAFWSSGRPLAEAMAAEMAPDSEGVEVYANEGRWVVDCPDCGGAQMACRTDPRFMCNECANVAVDGLWRPVVWPEQPVEIEKALKPRPPRNRNWLPFETVADLVAENRERGL